MAVIYTKGKYACGSCYRKGWDPTTAILYKGRYFVDLETWRLFLASAVHPEQFKGVKIEKVFICYDCGQEVKLI